MQHYESDYGRMPLDVSDRCPTIAIRHWLGRVHVSTNPASIAATLQDLIRRQRERGNADWTDAEANDALRFALWEHGENRAQYAAIMGVHYLGMWDAVEPLNRHSAEVT